MMNDFSAAFWGGCLAALINIAAHVTLYDKPNLPPVARYTIGLAGVNLGLMLTGALLDDMRLVILPWIVAGMVGAPISALYLWRHQQDATRTINLVRRARGNQGVGDAAWEARESDDRRD